MDIQLIELKKINDFLKKRFDVFICSSSFEDRCISIARHYLNKNIKKAIIIENSDLIDYVGPNTKKLSKIFGEKGNIVNISTSNPLFTADNLRSKLDESFNNDFTGTILLDVTAFTHESLLILMRLIKEKCPYANITGAYTNAKEYSIGDDYKHKWLSRGIGEVRTILGYPGELVPSRKMHLILLVGYEHERAIGLIEAIEPSSIALGYGRSASATTEKDKEANERYMHIVSEMAASFYDVDCFEIPCNNPYVVQKILKAQIDKNPEKNIIIAPMNNKLTTIGAAWVVMNNNHVQMCYAKALRYNYSGYSTAGSRCYIFEMK